MSSNGISVQSQFSEEESKLQVLTLPDPEAAKKCMKFLVSKTMIFCSVLSSVISPPLLFFCCALLSSLLLSHFYVVIQGVVPDDLESPRAWLERGRLEQRKGERSLPDMCTFVTNHCLSSSYMSCIKLFKKMQYKSVFLIGWGTCFIVCVIRIQNNV